MVVEFGEAAAYHEEAAYILESARHRLVHAVDVVCRLPKNPRL
jgi:hypothetical protein